MKYKIKTIVFGGVSMKRRKFLFCIMLIVAILLVAGCDNGSEYEKNEEVSIHVIVETDSGTAWSHFYTGDDSHKYDDAIIMVNDIKLEPVTEGEAEFSRFKIESSELKLSVGEKVTIEIRHSDLGYIKKEYKVPDCPEELRTDVDIKDYFAEEEDSITFSWDKIECDEYYTYMSRIHRGFFDAFIGEWVIRDYKTYTKEDLYVEYSDDGIEKKEKADSVTFYLYGANGQNRLTSFGRLLIKVNSPTYKSISTED